MALRLSDVAVCSAFVFSLAGCGSMPGGTSDGTNTAMNNVSGRGVVQSIDVIQSQPSSNVLGTVAGAVVGGVVGHQIGGGTGNTVATVAGAAGGAVAGNEIQKNMSSGQVQHSYRITVRMDNGVMQTLVQSAPPTVRTGDHVRLDNGAIVERLSK